MSSDRIEVKQETVADQKSSTASQLVYPSDDILSLFGVIPATSGVDVSPITAMRVPAVRAAVLAISEALGQLDVHVFKAGASEKATDHPVYALVHDSVNPWTSAGAFREQMTRDACLTGNCYASISRDEDGNPIEFHRLDPARVSLLVNPSTMEPTYRYTPLSGEAIEYGFADVLHVPTGSLNGLLGESPITQGREAIGLAIVMEQHAGRLFKNGARPASSLSFPNTLNADAIARIRASLLAQHSGAASGGTFITEGGAEFRQLGLSSVDAQFLEMRAFAISEIARLFRISPILLGEMGRATFANSAEMGRQFIAYSLMPWVRRWQGEIALKLFSPEDRKAYRVEFDTDDFDLLDIVARATGYSSMIASRVMNPNECRALEGLPPYAEGAAFLNPNVVTETVSV